MKGLIIGLTLGVLPAISGGRALQVVPVTLYTHFQQGPPASVVQAIQTELAAIMAPTGLQFSWHSLNEAGKNVASQLAIVHFKGECDAEDLRSESGFPLLFWL